MLKINAAMALPTLFAFSLYFTFYSTSRKAHSLISLNANFIVHLINCSLHNGAADSGTIKPLTCQPLIYTKTRTSRRAHCALFKVSTWSLQGQCYNNWPDYITPHPRAPITPPHLTLIPSCRLPPSSSYVALFSIDEIDLEEIPAALQWRLSVWPVLPR